MKNKDFALIIALFPTGWLGLHHLYVGNKKKAVIYTLFIWTTIPIILSYIDAIIISRMSKEKFIKKHSTEDEYIKYIKEKKELESFWEPLDSDNENKSNDNTYKEPDFSDYYGPWMSEDSSSEDSSSEDSSSEDSSSEDSSSEDSSSEDSSSEDSSSEDSSSEDSSRNYNKYG
jgi:TM2 domain-containing membrane protein YozV